MNGKPLFTGSLCKAGKPDLQARELGFVHLVNIVRAEIRASVTKAVVLGLELPELCIQGIPGSWECCWGGSAPLP